MALANSSSSLQIGPQKSFLKSTFKPIVLSYSSISYLFSIIEYFNKKLPDDDKIKFRCVEIDKERDIDIILETIDLKSDLKDVDVVVTGEGCLDRQSAMGKAPVGVAKMAKLYNKPVIAFAGSVTKEAKLCNQEGIDAYFPIIRNITTLQEAMAKENAKNNLTDTVEQVFRLWKIKQ